MLSTVHKFGALLGRGIFKAPWSGPRDEWVLLVVKTDHSLALPPITVPEGTPLPDLYDYLHGLLDTLDPADFHARPKLELISSFEPSATAPAKPGDLEQ